MKNRNYEAIKKNIADFMNWTDMGTDEHTEFISIDIKYRPGYYELTMVTKSETYPDPNREFTKKFVYEDEDMANEIVESYEN